MGSIVLLDLMGGVALLLWGLHMVLTGDHISTVGARRLVD
jgi:Na+/phosphate symporter